jgi:hypothetical protein
MPRASVHCVTSAARVRRRLLAGALLLGATLASGCLSPGTLPLPPPGKPDIDGPSASGDVRLTGHVIGGSTVFALNPRTNKLSGELTTQLGNYDFEIQADAGDEIVLWYENEQRQSPSITFDVPPTD